MNKLVKFENTTIDVQIINNVPMFELYAVGMALGQVKKNSVGTLYPAKDRIDKNVEKAEIKPCVRNVHKYITESQIYDLMLETRTDKCKTFRKWLTNEVLPELNRTGSYIMPKKDKQLSLYNYFDKKYKGEAVLSTSDIEYFTGLEKWKIRRALMSCTEYIDYYLLRGERLVEFKRENNMRSSGIPEMYIVTKSGFEAICKDYGIEVETPELFTDKSLPLSEADADLKAFDEDFLRATDKVIPSSTMLSLMGYIQRAAAEIQCYSTLLLTTDSRKNLEANRRKLADTIRHIRGYVNDIETLRIF